MKGAKKPKVGRPPKRKGERLSKTRAFRVRGSLDIGLRSAAERSGRSVSEEIEFRLERSFGMDELLGMALGEKAANLIQMIFMATAWIKTGSTRSYEALQTAICYIIAAFTKQPVPRLPSNEAEKDGARIAKDVLESFGVELTDDLKQIWNIEKIEKKDTPK